MVFFSFWVTSLSMIISSFICVAANGIILCFFYDWVLFHCVYAYMCVCVYIYIKWGFPDGPSGKETTCQGRKYKRPGINPWVRKIPWGRAQQPLQYCCLGNPVDSGAWQALVHRITKSWTWLKRLSKHVCIVYMYTCICMYVPMYVYIYIYAHIPCLFSFICRWTLACFQVLAIVNSSDVNREVHVSFWIWVLFGYMARRGLLDHMVVLFLVFWGNCILFSIVAAPMYISTNTVGQFPFLHIRRLQINFGESVEKREPSYTVGGNVHDHSD